MCVRSVMEGQIKKILIETEYQKIDVLKVESKIKEIKGILDAKIVKDGENPVLTYVIDSWSSDYDILVLIMDILSNDFSFESQPYFEEDFEVIREDLDKNSSDDLLNEETFINNDVAEESDNENKICNNSTHHHEHSEKNEKTKLFELGIAFVIFVIGFILSRFEKTAEISKYVQVIAFAISGYEILFEGLFGIFKGKIFSVNLLMTIASISALILGHIQEAVGIMFFYNVGELLEVNANKNVNKIVDNLKNLCSNEVSLIDNDGKVKLVNVKSVKVGDVLLIKSGEKISLDGIIIEGQSSVDTKSITGESLYKDLDVNDEVLGGYVCVNGTLKVKVSNDYENSTINKIAKIVEDSALKNTNQEKFLNKFAKIYTPFIAIFALLLAFIPPFFYNDYGTGLSVWGLRAVMLLCISCPCSILVSIPLTYFCGVGKGASNGVLIKSTRVLEVLANCDTVVFDKTGTLTSGELKISKIISTKKYSGEVLKLCAIAERNSNHPIAKAIVNNYGKKIPDSKNFEEILGKGVKVQYNDKELLCGNAKFLEENGIVFNKIDGIGIKLYLSYDKEYCGAVLLIDKPKSEAYGAILELNDFGVKDTIMLTGDNKEYATFVRKELKMNKSVSELLPNQKVEEIERIMSNNPKKSVAFVGDGINDAPVLTRADVGFSMGSLGSDLAVESSDVVITDDNLSKVPFTLKLAKRTKTISKQNLIFSLFVKTLIACISVFGLTQSLWFAVVADVGVLVLTIINSFRNKLKVI